MLFVILLRILLKITSFGSSADLVRIVEKNISNTIYCYNFFPRHNEFTPILNHAEIWKDVREERAPKIDRHRYASRYQEREQLGQNQKPVRYLQHLPQAMSLELVCRIR